MLKTVLFLKYISDRQKVMGFFTTLLVIMCSAGANYLFLSSFFHFTRKFSEPQLEVETGLIYKLSTFITNYVEIPQLYISFSLLLSFLILMILFSYLKLLIITKYSFSYVTYIARKVFLSHFSLNIKNILKKDPAEIKGLVLTDAFALVVQVIRPLLNIGSSIISLIAILVLLYLVVPGVLYLLILSFFTIISITFWNQKKLNHLGGARTYFNQERYSNVDEILNGAVELKLRDVTLSALKVFEKSNDGFIRNHSRALVLSEIPALVLQLLIYASVITMVAVIYVMPNALFIGWSELALITASIMKMIPEIQKLTASISQIQFSSQLANKLTILLKEGQQENLYRHRRTLEMQQSIELKNVSFSHNDENDILRDVNIKINKNEKVAIIGPSGSGKTTLTYILQGQITPSSGLILLDGKELHADELHNLADLFSYAPQDPFIMNASLNDNVRMWGNEDKDRLVDVTQMCEISELNASTLSTNRLSGGQKQRVSLARSIFSKRPIILTDEITSALDVNLKNRLLNRLHKYLKLKTWIAITHQLETLENFDKIYLIERGHINLVFEKGADYDSFLRQLHGDKGHDAESL